MNTDFPYDSKPPAKQNLNDYDHAYATFRWEDAEDEIGWDRAGRVNIAYSCIERHVLGGRGHRTALIYDNSSMRKCYSYKDIELLTNKFANALKDLGIKKGERIALFMPPCPEFYISLLAVVKIGAIAVPLHCKYMKDSVTTFLADSEPVMVITTNTLRQRIADDEINSIRMVVTTDSYDAEYNWCSLVDNAPSTPVTEWMEGQDPMLLLYTSGSTGNPKGVIHTHAGAPQYFQTGRWVLDFRDEDVYWCTADPGWITGISYGVWAPLLNGVCIVVCKESPNAQNCYRLLKDNKVTIWYTTPSLLRNLMNADCSAWEDFQPGTLRKIISVGEPLNPIINRWSMKKFNLTVHDSWWMTETGALMIANFSCLPLKPGSIGKAFPGIYAAIIDESGAELPPFAVGQLAIKSGWPAVMTGIWKDKEKYREYFRLPPWYLTGDLAYRDREGYIWFQGRIDDVIKIDSERVGPYEIESKLVEHPAVDEAGVIGKPDPLHGEIIKAYIVLNSNYIWSDELRGELCNFIEKKLGPRLVPREVEMCTSLPRTRSGKLMRRVLKSWELGLPPQSFVTTE
ncbi:MAG: acetyl-CoA synthetase [Peptococcaceae bacterium BRH_c4b]|nr:MAG: acetyl-CoA synthetase [Peptococcaceae bacterium BRH_c4b]